MDDSDDLSQLQLREKLRAKLRAKRNERFNKVNSHTDINNNVTIRSFRQQEEFGHKKRIKP